MLRAQKSQVLRSPESSDVVVSGRARGPAGALVAPLLLERRGQREPRRDDARQAAGRGGGDGLAQLAQRRAARAKKLRVVRLLGEGLGAAQREGRVLLEALRREADCEMQRGEEARQAQLVRQRLCRRQRVASAAAAAAPALAAAVAELGVGAAARDARRVRGAPAAVNADAVNAAVRALKASGQRRRLALRARAGRSVVRSVVRQVGSGRRPRRRPLNRLLRRRRRSLGEGGPRARRWQQPVGVARRRRARERDALQLRAGTLLA
jgi:hypothetical protein